MNQRRTLPEPQPTLKYQDERASAWGQSMVFMRQAYPNMALMTYDNIVHRGSEHVVLAKLVVGVGNESPTWLTWEACTAETTADNVPGGLVSRTVLADGGSLTAELYPLMAGRAPDAWEGGAVLRISCERETGLWLKFGGGKIAFMHYSPNISMAGDQIDCEESSAELRRLRRRAHRAEPALPHGRLCPQPRAGPPARSDGRGGGDLADPGLLSRAV